MSLIFCFFCIKTKEKANKNTCQSATNHSKRKAGYIKTPSIATQLQIQQSQRACALAGQTCGAVRVVLDFLFLLYQDKRKGKQKYLPIRGQITLSVKPVTLKPRQLLLKCKVNNRKEPVALAGQTCGAIRVVLDFLFLLCQDKRKGNKKYMSE